MCGDCGRSYSRKDNLNRHQRLECGKEPQFACYFCPYKAKRKGHLLNHIALKHSAPAVIPEIVSSQF